MFTSHEKKDERAACMRTILAAHGRASRVFASEACQDEVLLQVWDRSILTWFVNQINEMLNGQVVIAPIHSLCARCKPERKFEAARVEAGKLPIYYRDDLQGLWIDYYIMLCEVVVAIDEVFRS